MREELEETLETYEETADFYFETHSDISEIKKQADRFLELIGGEKILDVGCGPGRDAKYFSENGKQVVGIDLSTNLIDVARKYSPDSRFQEMDMRDLDFDDRVFDGIWCCASLHHLPKAEAKKVLKEFYRVLGIQGCLFLAVKRGEGERMVKKDHYQGNQKFLAFYKEDELRDIVLEEGFSIIDFFIDDSGDAWVNIFARKS